MSKPKSGKVWKVVSYSLDEEIKNMVKELAGFENMSQSEFLSFLVKNWDTGINPINKLNNILLDRKKLSLQIEAKDKEIDILTKQIKIFENWKKQKSEKKTDAIRVIKRKIMEKDFEGAEKVSKVWQRMTGISALELLYEANKQLKASGI